MIEPKWPEMRKLSNCHCSIKGGCGCRVNNYNEGIYDCIKTWEESNGSTRINVNKISDVMKGGNK